MDSSGDEDEEEVSDCEINPVQLDYLTPVGKEFFEKGRWNRSHRSKRCNGIQFHLAVELMADVIEVAVTSFIIPGQYQL